MFVIIKLIKKLLKIVNGNAAVWQVFLGALLGVLIGFLPIWPLAYGPAPLGLCLVIVAIVSNCHLGSVLLFWGIGTLLAIALRAPAVALGNALDGLARASAEIGFLHASLWSHTGYLGMSLIGLAAAPVIAALMAWTAHLFRSKLRDRLLQKKALVRSGKVAGNGILVRTTCWFFDL